MSTGSYCDASEAYLWNRVQKVVVEELAEDEQMHYGMLLDTSIRNWLKHLGSQLMHTHINRIMWHV